MSSVKKLEKMLADIKSGSAGGRLTGGKAIKAKKSSSKKCAGRSTGGRMSKKWEQMSANPFFNPYYGQGYYSAGLQGGLAPAAYFPYHPNATVGLTRFGRGRGGAMDKNGTGYDGILDYSARKSIYGGDCYQGGPMGGSFWTDFAKGFKKGFKGAWDVGFPIVKNLAGLGAGYDDSAPLVSTGQGKARKKKSAGSLTGGRDLGNVKDFSGGRSRGKVKDFSGGRARGNVKDFSGGKKAKKSASKNPWLAHVANFRRQHPQLSYKDVLSQAKSTY